MVDRKIDAVDALRAQNEREARENPQNTLCWKI